MITAILAEPFASIFLNLNGTGVAATGIILIFLIYKLKLNRQRVYKSLPFFYAKKRPPKGSGVCGY